MVFVCSYFISVLLVFVVWGLHAVMKTCIFRFWGRHLYKFGPPHLLHYTPELIHVYLHGHNSQPENG